MQKNKMKNELDQLLSEDFAQAKARRESVLKDIFGALDKPFVLFGAGHLGRKVLSIIQKLGLSPIAFIDNNPKILGTMINGVKVYSPKQLAQETSGPLPNVIVTVWAGELTDKMSDRLAPLRQLGYERIALFGHLAWSYPDHFLPHYSLDVPENVLLEIDDIKQAYDLLSDDESRQLFVNHVRWRLHLDYDLLPTASKYQIYFDQHFTNQMPEEVYYDIGAFDGDTVRDFISTGRLFKKIEAFEPSEKNHERLVRALDGMDAGTRTKIGAHHLALGDEIGIIGIESDAGPASRAGIGSSEQVSVTTLDALAGILQPPTFIKMDIEGFEPKCLSGGQGVIERHHPVLAVCVYHVQNHLWQILLQIHAYWPGYQFYLCPHLSDGWDLVLYAIPPSRVGKISGT